MDTLKHIWLLSITFLGLHLPSAPLWMTHRSIFHVFSHYCNRAVSMACGMGAAALDSASAHKPLRTFDFRTLLDCYMHLSPPSDMCYPMPLHNH